MIQENARNGRRCNSGRLGPRGGAFEVRSVAGRASGVVRDMVRVSPRRLRVRGCGGGCEVGMRTPGFPRGVPGGSRRITGGSVTSPEVPNNAGGCFGRVSGPSGEDGVLPEVRKYPRRGAGRYVF